MNKKINVVIFGNGKQSKFFKKILSQNRYVNLINNKNTKYILKKKFKKKIDLVIVATATPYHFKIINSLLSKNLNILCEKPFCSNYSQAYKIYRNSKKYKKLYFLNYQFRFENYIQFLKKLIASKRLGKIRSVNVDWITSGKKPENKIFSFKNSIKSGGIIKEFACHIIDYCKWIFNEDLFIKNIFAINNVKYLKDKNDVLKKCSGYDYCEIFLKNNLNVNFSIKINNFGKKPHHNIYLKGDNSFCSIIHEYPFFEKNLKIIYKVKNNKKIFYKYFKSNKNSRILATNKLLNKIILKILKNKNVSIPNFTDGLYTHKIIKDLYSINKKKL